MIKKNTISSSEYADRIFIQLKKGFLVYYVLKICSKGEMYTSDILAKLEESKLIVVEGTIYPLLSRLHNDGLLNCELKSSTRGPLRRYYSTTDFGKAIALDINDKIIMLNNMLGRI